MSGFLSSLGQAEPVAIEQQYQNIAKGDLAMAAQKQEMKQSAELHPLKIQAAEREANKAEIEIRKMKDEEEAGNRMVDYNMVFGDAQKASPKAMSNVQKYFEGAGLIKYIDGPDGKPLGTIKMKDIKQGFQLMEADTKAKLQLTQDRILDNLDQRTLLQQQLQQFGGKGGEKGKAQVAQLTQQLKLLDDQHNSLVETSAHLQGKGAEYAEKQMSDATTRRGQDITAKTAGARIGIEQQKMDRDELDKAEGRVSQLEGIKARINADAKDDPMMAQLMGGNTDTGSREARKKQLTAQVDMELDNLYKRHKSLGERQKPNNQLRAYDQLFNKPPQPTK
jgi:hypothetical protein